MDQCANTSLGSLLAFHRVTRTVERQAENYDQLLDVLKRRTEPLYRGCFSFVGAPWDKMWVGYTSNFGWLANRFDLLNAPFCALGLAWIIAGKPQVKSYEETGFTCLGLGHARSSAIACYTDSGASNKQLRELLLHWRKVPTMSNHEVCEDLLQRMDGSGLKPPKPLIELVGRYRACAKKKQEISMYAVA
jgi:hypothetical protein